MLYVKLRGLVEPFHRIVDLGLAIAYGEEIDLPESRLNLSTDLSTALRLGYVQRVSVFRVEQPSASQKSGGSSLPLPNSKIGKIPPSKLKVPVPPLAGGSLTAKDAVLPLGTEALPSDLPKDDTIQNLHAVVERMQASQEALIQRMVELVEQNQELVRQVQQRPLVPAPYISTPSQAEISLQGSSPVLEEISFGEEFEEDLYIPKVDTSNLKSSQASAVVTEEIASSNLDAASKLLRQHKKKK